MEHLLEYNQWGGNTGVKWVQGGWLLIKGKPNSDGKSHVFAAQAKNVSELARYRADGKPGIPVNMVNLYPDFYGVILNSAGEIKAMKIASDNAYLDKWIGIKGPNIGLNKNKTINWRDTITETSLIKVLQSNEGMLRNSPDLILPQK
jgi:hypothetical protein